MASMASAHHAHHHQGITSSCLGGSFLPQLTGGSNGPQSHLHHAHHHNAEAAAAAAAAAYLNPIDSKHHLSAQIF